MRLWASCRTVTLDELLPTIGRATEATFDLSIQYISRFGTGVKTRGWPCDLSALGAAALVQLPNVNESFTALTGTLKFNQPDPAFWEIDSVIPTRVLHPQRHNIVRALERTLAGEGVSPCEALGTLRISGKEVSGLSPNFVHVKIHRFRSLCLRANDPRFGTWHDVSDYRELSSDPDAIDAPVCLAEVELI